MLGWVCCAGNAGITCVIGETCGHVRLEIMHIMLDFFVDAHIFQLNNFSLLLLLCYRAFFWKLVYLSLQCLHFIQQLL